MSAFILLTAGKAAVLRGPSISSPGASLDPVERQGGLFILGVEVLADPAHEAHRVVLTGAVQMDGDDPEFPPAIEPRAE